LTDRRSEAIGSAHVTRRISTVVFCVCLLVRGATAGDEKGETPLMTAAYRGDVAAMRQLIAGGADVRETNRVGWTALHFAAGGTPIADQVHRGSPEAAALLLEKGADPNAAGKQNQRPLLFAAMNGNVETAKVLLDGGADPNARTAIGDTALFEAILRGKEGVVALLLARGADANGPPFVNGDTALVAAVAQAAKENFRHPDRTARATAPELATRRRIVHLLLEHKADMTATTRAGRTVLGLATSNGQLPLVKDILAHGADPNVRDRAMGGATALMFACHRGNRAMVETLLAAGADPDIKDDRGASALDFIPANADPRIREALAQASAKKAKP
jgi:uncharacterized protein